MIYGKYFLILLPTLSSLLSEEEVSSSLGGRTEDGRSWKLPVVSLPMSRTLTKSECASARSSVKGRSWMYGSAVLEEAPSTKSPKLMSMYALRTVWSFMVVSR